MLPLSYLLYQFWTWFAATGINLAIIIVLALCVPRIGRFAERLIEREVTARQADHDSKASLAFAGVGVYIGQFVAYFLLAVLFLQQIGFSLAGAAIPATVVSAAVGFGAQSIIADFLAGFFLLSEKQYGVGDWVRFTGNGVEVEGSVISITMRSTTIRTLNQETVTIPNATARVSINTSNYWSRAVVVIPVPLRGSEGAATVVSRAEKATRRALAQTDVAEELIGELDVHPATGITPPTTEGMPWTMDVRFMVQVQAGSQWLVERAIRMEILQEFWSEYSFAPMSSGEALDEVGQMLTTTLTAATEANGRGDARGRTENADAKTTVFPATSPATSPAADASTTATTPAAASETRGDHGEGHNPVPPELAKPDGTDPAAEANRKRGPKDAPEEDPADADTTVLSATGTTASATAPTATAEEEEESDASATAEDESKRTPWWKKVWQEFRTMRRSSAWLLGILAVLLIAKPLFFSTENADGDRIAGIFAPPAGPASSEETEVPEEDVDPSPTGPTGITSPAPSPTDSPAPTTGDPATPLAPTADPNSPATPEPQSPGGQEPQMQNEPGGDSTPLGATTQPDAPATTAPGQPTGDTSGNTDGGATGGTNDSAMAPSISDPGIQGGGAATQDTPESGATP